MTGFLSIASIVGLGYLSVGAFYRNRGAQRQFLSQLLNWWKSIDSIFCKHTIGVDDWKTLIKGSPYWTHSFTKLLIQEHLHGQSIIRNNFSAALTHYQKLNLELNEEFQHSMMRLSTVFLLVALMRAGTMAFEESTIGMASLLFCLVSFAASSFCCWILIRFFETYTFLILSPAHLMNLSERICAILQDESIILNAAIEGTAYEVQLTQTIQKAIEENFLSRRIEVKSVISSSPIACLFLFFVLSVCFLLFPILDILGTLHRV